jgi:hypothetical protein
VTPQMLTQERKFTDRTFLPAVSQSNPCQSGSLEPRVPCHATFLEIFTNLHSNVIPNMDAPEDQDSKFHRASASLLSDISSQLPKLLSAKRSRDGRNSLRLWVRDADTDRLANLVSITCTGP